MSVLVKVDAKNTITKIRYQGNNMKRSVVARVNTDYKLQEYAKNFFVYCTKAS